MSDFEHSLDIFLSERPYEPDPRIIKPTPVTSQESTVVTRGLASHLEVIYSAVKRNADSDRALEEVFNALSNDIDRFRLQALSLSQAFEFENSGLEHSRAYTAGALAYLLRGHRAHRTGVWLRGQPAEDQLIGAYHDVMRTEQPVFEEMTTWGHQQSRANSLYWKKQLEQNRQHVFADKLRKAIDASDHHVEV